MMKFTVGLLILRSSPMVDAYLAIVWQYCWEPASVQSCGVSQFGWLRQLLVNNKWTPTSPSQLRGTPASREITPQVRVVRHTRTECGGTPDALGLPSARTFVALVSEGWETMGASQNRPALQPGFSDLEER